MASIFGNNIKISIFGQSHSEMIGVTIDGLPCGFKIDVDKLRAFMDRRVPGKNAVVSERYEADRFNIISGMMEGKTCGAPLTAIIHNTDVKSVDYEQIKDCPRPAHADFSAHAKYRGYEDFRGGGHFSGRLTAPLCFAGGLVLQMLNRQGISIKSEIEEIYGKRDKFDEIIEEVKSEGDSVGGIVSCSIDSLPSGIGAPMFDGLENKISQAVFAIPGIKGIEFGAGFDLAKMKGSQANDEYFFSDGKVGFKSNNNGGILGGISTGAQIFFRVCIKPTPSISKSQNSISYTDKDNVELKIVGRHDPCIVTRALPCVESAAAIAVFDLMLGDLKAAGRCIYND